jgi:DNA-binding GntR family transcriptional regulator
MTGGTSVDGRGRAHAIRRTSIVDTVAERLRGDILDGSIQPGERIRVSELEKRFGVSHIPIREALRRLEAEGLVVTSPQRATLAAGVALDDLAGLYELRRLIEVEVARSSVGRARDEDREAVRDALAALEAAARDPDSAEFWERHQAFHWALLAPGGSAWTRRVLDQLWQSAERYVRLFVSTFGSMEGPMREHRQMVEAFEAGDADRLADLVMRHLTGTEETVREGYLARRRHAEASPAAAGA